MIKKILILLLFSVQCFGAARFWVGGHPTNNNWNQTGSGTTNWSATSGGAGGASVPGASDDVTFDGAGGGNSTATISATITVLSFTVTGGYTSTITHNAVLTVAGNVTLNTSYTIAGSSGITISATSTITSGGKTWPNVMTWSGANTKTLSGNLNVSGLLTVSTLTTLNQTGTDTLILAGGLTNSSGAISGTARIKLTGGTWTGAVASPISNNLDFAGNITLSANVAFGGVSSTLTYISGTITTTSSKLTTSNNVVFNTNGVTFNDITFASSATFTLNSLLTATGNITINAAISPTFAGTSGFSFANLIINNVNAQTITLNDAASYTITTSLEAYKSRAGAILTITSDHASNLVPLTLNQGATCNLLANMTRIDASGGRTIRTFNGTVTSCLNVQEFHDLQTIGF